MHYTTNPGAPLGVCIVKIICSESPSLNLSQHTPVYHPSLWTIPCFIFLTAETAVLYYIYTEVVGLRCSTRYKSQTSSCLSSHVEAILLPRHWHHRWRQHASHLFYVFRVIHQVTLPTKINVFFGIFIHGTRDVPVQSIMCKAFKRIIFLWLLNFPPSNDSRAEVQLQAWRHALFNTSGDPSPRKARVMSWVLVGALKSTATVVHFPLCCFGKEY